MGLSGSAELSIAYKKLVGYIFRDKTYTYYGECPSRTLYLNKDEIYSETIPSTPPGATTAVVKVYTDAGDGNLTLSADGTVPDNKSWRAEVAGTTLTKWIHPRFGGNYVAKIYEDNGAGSLGDIIPPAHSSLWSFDYETGWLAFENDPTAGSDPLTTPIHLEAYQYIGDMLNEAVHTDSINISGAVSVGGTMHVSGAATFGSTLTVSSAVTLGTTLAVCGTTTLHNNVTICGALTICGSATLNGTALGTGGGAGNAVYIEEKASAITDNTGADLYLNFDANLLVTTASGTCATISLDPDPVIDSLNVSANVSVGGTLHVSGAVTFGSTLAVSGTVTLNGTALTSDILVDHSSVSVSGSSGLQGGGTITANRTISVNYTHVSSSGHTHTAFDALSISGTLSVGTTLHVCGAATFNSSGVFDGNLTTCGTLTVNGTAITNAAGVNVVFNQSAITTTDLEYDTADFTVTTGTGTCATVSLASAISVDTLNVSGAASVGGTLHVSGAVTFGDALTICGLTTLEGLITRSSIVDYGGLRVCGAVTLAGSALIISGAVTIHDTTIISGNVSIGDAAIDNQKKLLIEQTYTPAAGDLWGIWCGSARDPVSNTTGINGGIGGFATLVGRNFSGASTYGLLFGPYNNASGGGATSLTSYGISTWAARGFGGRFECDLGAGLQVFPYRNDFNNSIRAKTIYGICVEGAIVGPGGGSTAIISSVISMKLGEQTIGDHNFQLELDGTNTASCGIWFGTVTAMTTVGGNYTASVTVHIGIQTGANSNTSSQMTYISNLTNTVAGYDTVTWNTTNHTLHYNASSLRFKKDVTNLEDEWKLLLNVQPRKFKSSIDDTQGEGYIAEEIDQLGLNNLVRYDADNKPKGLKDRLFTLYAIEIIKDQQKRIEALEEKILHQGA